MFCFKVNLNNEAGLIEQQVVNNSNATFTRLFGNTVYTVEVFTVSNDVLSFIVSQNGTTNC